MHFRLGKLRRQREGKHPATGPDVHHPQVRVPHGAFHDQHFCELLRLRPRDQRALIANEEASAKFDGSEQMLERLALTPAAHHVAERREFRFRQLPFELQIKVNPFHA